MATLLALGWLIAAIGCTSATIEEQDTEPGFGIVDGRLAEGARGDVTILDLDRTWTFEAEKSESRSRNTPFDGREFVGGPWATIVGGEVVWRSGK